MAYDSRQLSRDQNIASVLLACLSMAAIWFFYRHGDILLSGDAVAHINISRRLFDSKTPGPLQLGTVWLPLQHILTAPFVISQRMWQSGIGGSVISAVGYVIGGRGMLRLIAALGARAVAWLALAVYALNPNLLYVQSTALNEPLAIALLIWAVVYFSEFVRKWRESPGAGEGELKRLLLKGTLVLDAAMLVRYDGWFLAAMCWLLMLIYAVKDLWRNPQMRELAGKLKGRVAICLALTALAPALWLGYNYVVFGDPLAFANGPYSAKAIAGRTTRQGAPPHPGYKSLPVAALYFEKAAKLNLGTGVWPEIVLVLAVAGSLWALRQKMVAPILLLWSMLLFYTLSIAYGGVPIFMPVWWPFSYYNTRYGLELLPAIAVGFALLICLVVQKLPTGPHEASALGGFVGWAVSRKAIWVFASMLILISYLSAWRWVPVCLREVRANGRSRGIYDARLAEELKKLPPNSTLLIYAGDHSGALQSAGIPFRTTINEGNYGLWQAAMSNPADSADYIIAAAGDPVAVAVETHPNDLEPVGALQSEGEPPTVVYRSLLRHRPLSQ